MLLSAENERRTVACVAGRRVVEVVAEMGFRVVVLDDNLPFQIACLADVPIEVDLRDPERVEAVLRKEHERQPIDAVLSVRDSYVPLAAELAERLGLRGLAPAAARRCNDKAAMRRALDDHGVANPSYALIRDVHEALSAAERIGFPVIVKRVRGAGGAGVRLCRDADELTASVPDLASDDGDIEDVEPDQLIVEEYVDGPEFAVQVVAVDGVVEVLNVLTEHVGPPPRMAETGYDFPADLPAGGEKRLADYVVDALAALGFDNGVAHVQVRLAADGPRVIEVNPRPPGGQLPYLTEVLTGVDLVRASVQAALGDPITRTPARASRAIYRCVVFDRSGVVGYDPAALREPSDTSDTSQPLVSIDVDPGDRVHAVDHPDGGVYGRVLVFGDDADELADSYQRLWAALDLRVDDVPVNVENVAGVKHAAGQTTGSW